MLEFVISGPGAPSVFNCVRFSCLFKAYSARLLKRFGKKTKNWLESVKEIGCLS